MGAPAVALLQWTHAAIIVGGSPAHPATLPVECGVEDVVKLVAIDDSEFVNCSGFTNAGR